MTAYRLRLVRVWLAVLLVILALPSAVQVEAQDDADGIDGSTYTSPIFGYSFDWDDAIWEVADVYSDDGYDAIALAADDAALYIEAFYFYQGDAEDCLAGERTALADEAGLDDLEPLTDDEGNPYEVVEEGVATALYVLPESDESDESIVYLQCQTLIPDTAVLVITAFLNPDTLEDSVGAVEDVTGTIDTSAVGETGITASDFEQTVVQTDQDVTAFWDAIFEELGQNWVSPKFITYFEPTETECGDIEPGYDGPLYCPGDQTVYLDETMMEDEMLPFGMIVVQVMLAHEIAHHVQDLLQLDGCNLAACGPAEGSLAIELQADCLAGAWMRDAADRQFVSESDLKRVEVGVKSYFGDPPGTAKDDPEAHGSGEVRFAMFMAGYTQGIGACAVQ